MTAEERDALRALRRTLAVLHAYNPTCTIHRIAEAEAAEALGGDGVSAPLLVNPSHGEPYMAGRIAFDDRLHIFTKETP